MKNLITVVSVIAMLVLVGFCFKYTQYLEDQQEMVEVRISLSTCYGKGKIYCLDNDGQWFTTTRVFGKVQLSETKDLKEGEIPTGYRIIQGLKEANISISYK